ncbi:MAG: hypothetical protein WCD76_01165 [Pyrinomonadaceae bacterium]
METDNRPPSGDGATHSTQGGQPAVGAMSGPVPMLVAYSAERASVNDVMRSLVSHQGWLVPLGFFAQSGEEHRVVESTYVLSSETSLPPDGLWIFTDREAAYVAQAKGASLGTYAGGIRGTELFRKVAPGTKSVYVNPGSPTERTWMFQDGGGIEAGKIWADAIALEESFEGWRQTGKPDATAVRNYRAFLVFNHSSGPIITLPDQMGMSNPAAAFTAPDCADMFLTKLGEEQRAAMRQAVVGGDVLINEAAQLGIDGLLLNPFGPGATYAFPFNDLHHTEEEPSSRILMMMIGDALRLPSGFEAASPHRCMAYCKVPGDWVEGVSPQSDELWLKGPTLKPDKLERLFDALYGKTWRGGNSDGSQYVVTTTGARLLNPQHEGERPWHSDDPNDKRFRYFYFVADADGQFKPVSPTEL